MKAFLTLFMIVNSIWAMALDQEDVNLIDKFRLVDSKVLLNEGEWSVNPEDIDKDDYEYGINEFRDLTDWKNLKSDEWFDFKVWTKHRELKDKTPLWRVYLRNKMNSEVIARVIKCIGVCRYFHDLRGIDAGYLTVLREGDELLTEENSYAWVILTDGTLLRLSPKTSVTFGEVNLSKKSSFFLLRLNFGYLQSLANVNGEFKTLDKVESDMAFYPLMIKEANREFYAIKEYREFDEIEKIMFTVTENPGHISQYKSLNKRIEESAKKFELRDSILHIYAPNFSTILKNSHGSFYYAVNGKGYFKLRQNIENFEYKDKRKQSIEYFSRSNKKLYKADENKWNEVTRNGVTISEDDETIASKFVVTEAFIKRIPTMFLAKEVFWSKYFSKLYDPNITGSIASRMYQYRLWDEEKEMRPRQKFLNEYIRRVELTNLASIYKVFKEFPVEKYDKSYYAAAMEDHYQRVRSLHYERNQAVREMTDSEYYLWLVQNAKE